VVVVVLVVLGASLAHAERDTRAATARHWAMNVFIFRILVLLVNLPCKTRPLTDPMLWGVTLLRTHLINREGFYDSVKRFMNFTNN
jgi:hypothetical protein